MSIIAFIFLLIVSTSLAVVFVLFVSTSKKQQMPEQPLILPSLLEELANNPELKAKLRKLLLN